MTKEKIKAIIYTYMNIASLYIAAISFELLFMVDFFKGGDEND